MDIVKHWKNTKLPRTRICNYAGISKNIMVRYAL